ncbi:hypothetical protein AB0F17_08110 [Nonomuraea sp. NPDC026600]
MNSQTACLLMMLASVGVFLIGAVVVCAEQIPDGVRWVWRRITGRAPGSQ